MDDRNANDSNRTGEATAVSVPPVRQQPPGIIHIDSSGRVLAANDQAAAILGVTRDTLVGRVYHPEEFPLARPDGSPIPPEATPFTRVLAAGETVNEQPCVVALPDRRELLLAVSAIPLVDAAGTPTAGVFVIEDIGERCQHEQEARAIFDNAPILLWSVVERADGKLYYERVNLAFAAIEGLAPDHYRGRRLTDLHSELQMKHILYTVAKARSGQPHVYEATHGSGPDARHFEMRFVRTSDTQEPVVRFVGIGLDVTIRRRAEQALKESEEKYRALTQEAPIGVYIASGRRFLFVNPAMAEIYGYSDDELLAADADSLVLARDREIIRRRKQRRVPGEADQYTMRVRRKDGRTAVLEVRTRPIEQDGETVYLGSCIDITDRRRDERQLRRYREHLEELVRDRTAELAQARERLEHRDQLATFGRVAGNMAHELRTPIATVKQSLHYLRHRLPEQLDERSQHHIELISDQVDRIARTMTTVLDFTRDRKPERRRTELYPLVGDALAEAALDSGISVEIDIVPSSQSVLVDRAQFLMVLRNLFVNAAEAMPEGGTLSLSARAEGDMVALRVADTGAGIPPEALTRVFEPLYTTRKQGAGLGLTIARGLVEANGGTITVTSPAGQGASFVLKLPVP